MEIRESLEAIIDAAIDAARDVYKRQVLVNAKDVLPSKEDTVVLETTSLVPPRAAAAGGQN